MKKHTQGNPQSLNKSIIKFKFNEKKRTKDELQSYHRSFIKSRKNLIFNQRERQVFHQFGSKNGDKLGIFLKKNVIKSLKQQGLKPLVFVQIQRVLTSK